MRQPMKFDLNQPVRITGTKETAMIVGRAEFSVAENAYFLRYKNKSGLMVTQMWGESAIESFDAQTDTADIEQQTTNQQYTTEFFIEQLTDWVHAQKDPFTLIEVLNHLRLNPDIGINYLDIPTIYAALEAIGFVQEGAVFIPVIKITRDELIS